MLWHLPEHMQMVVMHSWVVLLLLVVSVAEGQEWDVCVVLYIVALILYNEWLCEQFREHIQADGVLFPWL